MPLKINLESYDKGLKEFGTPERLAGVVGGTYGIDSPQYESIDEYIKVGGNKLIQGKDNLSASAGFKKTYDEAGNLAVTYNGKSQNDFLQASIASKPNSAELTAELGASTGLLPRMDGIRQQMGEIQRSMLGDQSKLFSATNPDGTPIDPRVKVAQYQANMNGYMQRLETLTDLESIYKAELKTLTDGATRNIEATNEKNKTILQYMNNIQDQEYRKSQALEQKRQFDEQLDIRKSQFDEQLNKPQLKQDAVTGEWKWLAPPQTGAGGGSATIKGSSGGQGGGVYGTGVKGKVITPASQKKLSFNDYFKNLKLEDKDYTIDEVYNKLDEVKTLYPTESTTTQSGDDKAYNALYNVAPPKMKKAINKESDIQGIMADMETYKKADVQNKISELETAKYSKEEILGMFKETGFFDVYKSAFWGDDDQYDAIQDWYRSGISTKEFNKIIEGL